MWNELGISPSDEASKASGLASQLASADGEFDLSILRTTQKLASAGTDVTCNADTTILVPDAKTLERLTQRKLSLEADREGRMQKIQELYDQLFPLWTRLGVSDEEADDFVEVWKGCELRCIQAVSVLAWITSPEHANMTLTVLPLQYEAELARMLQVKADNMAIFIHREREDIIALWDALFYSDAERATFSPMESGQSTPVFLSYNSN